MTVCCQLSGWLASAQVLDFPPLLGLLDAHAAWHAATVCRHVKNLAGGHTYDPLTAHWFVAPSA